MLGLMLTVIGLVAFSAALVGNGQRTALADPNPPGNDGECTHGNSNQPCRPDPQPDHGKDCQAHGANIDGNEDHCLGEPAVEPTAPPTEPPNAPSTEEPTAPPTEEAVAPEEATPIVVTVPTTEAAAVTTALPPQAPVEQQAVTAAAPVTALPATGSGGETSGGDIAALTWASFVLLGSGGGLLVLSWKMRRESE
jgi:hypothetical protein